MNHANDSVQYSGLPQEFITEMTDLWQRYKPPGTLQDFLCSFEKLPQSGLNLNTLKIQPEIFLLRMPHVNGKVPWTTHGYYLPADHQAGHHPYYAAGLYYLQDPSAMLPAAVAAVKPGERVLDLCAAPGGKATAMAYDLTQQGMLWANEINPKRARALLKNMELSGTRHVIVTQSEPQYLAERLPDFFDCIMLDVPCSGSGMLRKDARAKASWYRYQTTEILELQAFLIDQAWLMLKPGGRLIYSTCSFSIAENEFQIDRAARRHPDLRVLPIETQGVSGGLTWPDAVAKTESTARIWPHIQQGEGHYCALIQKTKQSACGQDVTSEPDFAFASSGERVRINRKGRASDPKSDRLTNSHPYYEVFVRFCRATFNEKLPEMWLDQGYRLRLQANHLHLVPSDWNLPPALNYLKTGVLLGQFTLPRSRAETNRRRSVPDALNVRFEPAHSLLLAASADVFRYSYSAEPADKIVMQYLRGESPLLPPDFPDDWPEQAWGALLIDNCPLGWMIKQGAVLKNKYPRGWFSFLSCK